MAREDASVGRPSPQADGQLRIHVPLGGAHIVLTEDEAERLVADTMLALGKEHIRAAVYDANGNVILVNVSSKVFKPSQVVLTGVPLSGTMGRSEVEVAAALLVMACVHHGDQWQALTLDQIADAIHARIKDEPVASWNRNPFLRPDIDGLVAGGWVERTSPEEERRSPLRFTTKGLDALTRWVR
jgi:hypothetical protein